MPYYRVETAQLFDESNLVVLFLRAVNTRNGPMVIVAERVSEPRNQRRCAWPMGGQRNGETRAAMRPPLRSPWRRSAPCVGRWCRREDTPRVVHIWAPGRGDRLHSFIVYILLKLTNSFIYVTDSLWFSWICRRSPYCGMVVNSSILQITIT
jgi:hypothetical protein